MGYKEYSLLSCDEVINKIITLNEFNQEKEKLIIKYHSIFYTIIKFIYTWKLADVLKNSEFFFTTFMDSRGRVYYKGNSLFPQGDELAKNLLYLKTEVRKNLANITKEEKYQYERIMLKPNLGKAFFTRRKFESGILNSVSLDVSNSGLQILSAIVGLKKGLIDTNFIQEDPLLVKPNDLYLIILDKIKKEYQKNILILKLKNNINYMESTQLEKQQMDLLLSNYIKFINRAFIKGWIVRYIYSEGDSSRVFNIIDSYKEKNAEDCKKFQALSSKQFYLVGKTLCDSFKKAINQEYPEICKFSEKLQNLFSSLIKNKPATSLVICSKLSEKDSFKTFFGFF